MESRSYEQQFYAILEKTGRVGPALRHALQNLVQIKSIKKGKILAAQPYDMHILLEGMIIKRRDYEADTDICSEVLDFIGAGEAIYHPPNEDDSYFQVELDSIAILIRQPDIIPNFPGSSMLFSPSFFQNVHFGAG